MHKNGKFCENVCYQCGKTRAEHTNEKYCGIRGKGRGKGDHQARPQGAQTQSGNFKPNPGKGHGKGFATVDGEGPGENHGQSAQTELDKFSEMFKNFMEKKYVTSALPGGI